MKFIKAFISVALAMLVLDLVWLGVVATSIYNEALGPLRARDTVWVAAALFYFQYVLVVVLFAVLPTANLIQAAKRGAGVGWLAYATYELTNWALIEGWPSSIVMMDIAWGVVLTAAVATIGRTVVGGKA